MQLHRSNWIVWIGIILLIPACTNKFQSAEGAAKRTQAEAIFQERCKSAGEKIYSTREGVEGIFVLKIRPSEINYGSQFYLDDPYGSDLGGDAYISGFIRGHYETNVKPAPTSPPGPKGYQFVDAVDLATGVRYRYTGAVVEPWQTDKNYLKGYLKFQLSRKPAMAEAPRYGVTYDDISTREDREHWIAGSSLKVVDIKTNEVLAERVGYMIDLAQGSQAGGRSPWLLAADHACPIFASRHGSSAQVGQTRVFVEKVLKPN